MFHFTSLQKTVQSFSNSKYAHDKADSTTASRMKGHLLKHLSGRFGEKVDPCEITTVLDSLKQVIKTAYSKTLTLLRQTFFFFFNNLLLYRTSTTTVTYPFFHFCLAHYQGYITHHLGQEHQSKCHPGHSIHHLKAEELKTTIMSLKLQATVELVFTNKNISFRVTDLSHGKN